MSQYAELRDFGGLYNHPRMNEFEHSEYFDNKNAAFAKRGRRSLRKSIGIERKEARHFDKLLEFLKKLAPLLTEPYFNQLGSIIIALETYHAGTVKALSVGGSLDKQVRQNSDLRKIASTLIPQVKKFIEEVNVPFMASLKELDAFCNQEAAILEAKRKAITLNIPIDAGLKSCNVTPKIILMDTSFLFRVLEARKN
ncbi:hypothetical protein CL619_01045 [archaeon]|nr:hypothetical protein [archaeon]|tara:strand:- start:247 stop:837 length:591 start_codon:yes stop_codon:yes gene_type:complete